VLASKAYAADQPGRSWWHLLSSLTLLAAGLGLAMFAPVAWIYIPASLFAGLMLVRVFIIYHDYMHGTILRQSTLARWIFHLYGLLVLSPPNIWKESHDDHHKNNSKSSGPAPGSFMVLTIEEYADASIWQRLAYRLVRHPLIIAAGYFTSFFWSITLYNFLSHPRRNYMAGLSIVLHVAVGVALLSVSWQALLWGMLVPMIIAGATGTYLFYAQHNFPGARRKHGDDWDYVYAALNSSSYMRMNKVLHWFTGNIGYHHVHHLNAKIPFYRLPEAMAGIRELQNNVSTSLHPVEVFRCLRLKLLDTESRSLVSFRTARKLRRQRLAA